MSYILDALRRADAERERGTVPSLHTQQFGGLSSDDEAAPKPRLLVGAVVALALALAGVLAWTFLGGSEPPPKPVVQAVTPAPAPMPPSQTTIAAAPPVAPMVAPSAPASAAAPAPATPPAAKPATRSARARTTKREAVPEASREAAGTSAPKTSPAAEDRLYALSELPESVRRELPKISYGGGSYSPDKASRLLFLNGQVFHEGDTIAPGLVLRQVRQKGAILTYKGYRFEIGP